jgi:cytochrome c-type biogenesis protein CcmF
MFPGDEVTVGDYRMTYVDTTTLAFADRTEFRTTVEVYRNGEFLTVMYPRRTFHPDFNMASTLAAIRSTPVEDFYVVPSENLPDGSVGFRILVNPLVWWMWVAGPVLILGTVVSLWPEGSRGRVRVARPETVAITSGETRPNVV